MTGSASRSAAPEQAVLRLRATAETESLRESLDRAGGRAQALADRLGQLHDPVAGPVIRWALGDWRQSQHRPYHPEGALLPYRFTVEVPLTAVFNDSAALGEFIAAEAAETDIEIDGVSWELTTQTTAALLDEARRDAVADALHKASIYAEAVGRGEPVPVRICVPGSSGPGPAPRMELMAAKLSGPSFSPDDVVVTDTVEVHFTAH